MPQLNPDLYQLSKPPLAVSALPTTSSLGRSKPCPTGRMVGGCARRWCPVGSSTASIALIATIPRQRLYFNYEWAVPDPDGHDNLHLVKCFNENCVAMRERQRDLPTRLPSRPGTLPGPRAVRGRAAASAVCACAPQLAFWSRWTGYRRRMPQRVPVAAELRSSRPLGDLVGAVLRTLGQRTA